MILADGSTSATITALARDSNNLLIAGVPVSFKASSGGLAGYRLDHDRFVGFGRCDAIDRR